MKFHYMQKTKQNMHVHLKLTEPQLSTNAQQTPPLPPPLEHLTLSPEISELVFGFQINENMYFSFK